jgi:hypothetical protein
MSCKFAHDDGAYLLGALAPSDRLEYERHLAGCDDCTTAVRDLAGLPGLLGRIERSVLEDPAQPEPVPEALLPALLREVHRARRRRTVAVGVLAAAAVAVIVALGAAVVRDDATPTGVAAGPETSEVVPLRMAPIGEVPVTASLTLEQVSWGTRLDLTCTYDTASVDYELPAAVDYWLVVRTRDGRTEDVGSWRSVDGRTMKFSAGTAFDRREIASVEVRAPGGRVVLKRTV